MRCPDCNKFVPYGEQDPELDLDLSQPSEEDTKAALEDGTGTGTVEANITGTVRIVLTCEECGAELKEATLDVEFDVEVPVNPPEGTWTDESEWEVHDENAENDQRTEGKGRYTKTFYGAQVSGNLTRSYRKADGTCEDASIEFSWSDYIQASSMDELV